MTRTALARLYPGGTPQRGQLHVDVRERQDEGVAGVVAAVASLVTGAAGSGGFKGLAGRHARRDLLGFGVPMRGQLRFTRLDSGTGVEVSHRPDALPRPPQLKTAMQAALAPQSAPAEREAFARAWQDWVRDTDRTCRRPGADHDGRLKAAWPAARSRRRPSWPPCRCSRRWTRPRSRAWRPPP